MGEGQQAPTRRLRNTMYNAEGKVTRDDKAEFERYGSTTYSADGKRILWTNKKAMGQYNNDRT